MITDNINSKTFVLEFRNATTCSRKGPTKATLGTLKFEKKINQHGGGYNNNSIRLTPRKSFSEENCPWTISFVVGGSVLENLVFSKRLLFHPIAKTE